MRRKVQVNNLQEVHNYRTHCPFCSGLLKWECSHGIVGATPEISISEGKDHYKLSYDGSSTFCTQVSAYIERILLHKTTNDITYIQQEENVWPIEHIDSAIKHNTVILCRTCDCVFDYRITSGLIDLSSLSYTNFIPDIFSESFCIDEQESDVFTKITQIYPFNQTKISSFALQQTGVFNCIYEREIPIVNFDWDDVDAIFGKVRFLLTFS